MSHVKSFPKIMGYQYQLLLLQVLFYGITFHECKELPSFINKCKLDYPQVNECLTQRIEDLKPYLADGIPKLKIPAISPLRLPKIEVETGEPGARIFKLTVTDIRASGLEKLYIKGLEFDLDHNKIDLTLHVPRVHVNGICNFQGKIVTLNLDSTGPGEINITNISIKIHVDTKIHTKNGKRYLDFVGDKSAIEQDSPSVYFHDLFKGNEAINKEMNKLINENIEEFDRDIRPLIHKIVYEYSYRIVKQIFQDYALEELFL